ncbi:hypothetical protein EWM64_g7918 [Hericium alpestre]|uniref:Uncharacterized protein n=1 Tax=Hericium alpestre TaxID=135208 RepID=A0A4Y9ZPA3_9AGAM|nr:hypothetical protein EWM64_g7918 [Hericium alpestre]
MSAPPPHIDLKKAQKAREQRQAASSRKEVLSKDVIAGRSLVMDAVEKIAADNDKNTKYIASQVYTGASTLIAKRAPSLFNAVMHHAAKHGTGSSGGEGRGKLPNMSHDIAQSDWRNMPAEQKQALIHELKEDRREIEARQTMAAPQVIVRDYNKMLAKLEAEVINLGQRSGAEYLVFFLKDQVSKSYESHVIASPKVAEACGSLFAQTPDELALKLETFCISGLAGTLKDMEHHNKSLLKRI